MSLWAWPLLCLACGPDADSVPESGGAVEEGAPAVETDTAETGVQFPEAGAPAVEADSLAEGLQQGEAPAVDADVLPEGLEEGEVPAVEVEEDPDSLPEALPDVLIPAGTRIQVVGEEDISTADYFVDDPVVAMVWEDVTGTDGTVLIPTGTRMLGRVLASMGSGGAGEAPVLEIAFETLSSMRYERPLEGAVVEALVVLDPAGDFARRRAGDRRAAVTMVPAKIMAGSVIVVELRAPVLVPLFPALPDSLMPGDTLVPGETLAPGDTLVPGETLVPGDTLAPPDPRVRRDTVIPAEPARYSG